MSGSRDQSRFIARTCVVCGSPADPAVDAVTEDVQGTIIEQRFCTAAHRDQYTQYSDVYNGVGKKGRDP